MNERRIPGLVVAGGVIAALCGAAWADVAAAQGQAIGYVFHDRNGNGQRDPGEEGLPGIRVSNQREVVATDEHGRWRLPVNDDTTFFVIKPRGWMTPVDRDRQLPRFFYTHKPAGSPKLRYKGVAPTGPLPESIDFPLYPREEPDRFQAVFFGDTQARNEKELQYMAHDVIAELVGTEAAFGVTLGDVVFNDLSLFDSHNRTVALIGIPWYNVLGNHDINMDVPDDKQSDETFERFYGPNYYAFDHGPTHFIVLDNIHWTGPTQERKGEYHAELGEEQLTFVRNSLSFVPHDRLVVLMMHIPLTSTNDREALYRLIEDRPYTLSVSAHRHWQAHQFLTEKDGWRGAEPHHHVISVTVCGSWWRGAPDAHGIPHATMRDGAPNGYAIYTFDGHQATIDFKAARRPAAYQMHIHAPYTVNASDAAEVEVFANVFGGSERSKVEMRLGDDGPWLPMERVLRPDPAYVEMRARDDAIQPRVGLPMREPDVCQHLWMAKLPADPPRGLTLIHVRTTDMYGRVFEACRAIRIKGPPG